MSDEQRAGDKRLLTALLGGPVRLIHEKVIDPVRRRARRRARRVGAGAARRPPAARHRPDTLAGSCGRVRPGRAKRALPCGFPESTAIGTRQRRTPEATRDRGTRRRAGAGPTRQARSPKLVPAIRRERAVFLTVTRGLDPRVHWMPGSSPSTTKVHELLMSRSRRSYTSASTGST
jgi:hypothetical protein